MTAPLRLSARVGFVALVLLAAGFPGSAVAPGGGGGDGSSRSQAKPEDPQYSAAVTAIKAGDYGKAIPLLQGVAFRYPRNSLLDKWDSRRALEREHTMGRRLQPLPLRAFLREAGFARTQASGEMTTEAGPPADFLEATRRVAQGHLIGLRGMLGELVVAQGWTTKHELEQISEALIRWGEDPDAFYARPTFTAIGWI